MDCAGVEGRFSSAHCESGVIALAGRVVGCGREEDPGTLALLLLAAPFAGFSFFGGEEGGSMEERAGRDRGS